MFTSEPIPELQGTGELPGSNQKSCPIDLPFVFYFPHFIPPLGEGISLRLVVGVFLGWIFCEGENESTRDQRRGQSQIIVQFENLSETNFGDAAPLGNALRLATGATMRLEPSSQVRGVGDIPAINFHKRHSNRERHGCRSAKFCANTRELRRLRSAGEPRAAVPACQCAPLFLASRRRTLPFAAMLNDGNLRGHGQFPATRWSLIVAARSVEPEERQRALEILIAAYWKPVYKYIRLRWDKDNEQAQDLSFGFFPAHSGEGVPRQVRSAAGPLADFSARVRGPFDCQ